MPSETSIFNNELKKLTEHRDKIGDDLSSTERHLAGQLILLATVFISATIVILGLISDRAIPLALATKILILLGFISLVLSVFAGIASYFEVIKHSKDWINVKDELARKISFNEYSSPEALRQDMIAKQSALKSESGRIFLYAQITSLVFSFGIYISLVTILVF